MVSSRVPLRIIHIEHESRKHQVLPLCIFYVFFVCQYSDSLQSETRGSGRPLVTSSNSQTHPYMPVAGLLVWFAI